jgi:hypothetical protein
VGAVREGDDDESGGFVLAYYTLTTNLPYKFLYSIFLSQSIC